MKGLAFAGITLLVLGCSTVDVIPLEGYDYVERSPSSYVEVFQSEKAITRPYKRIAILEHTAPRGFTSTMYQIRAKAQTLGADGVIVKETSTKQSVACAYGNYYGFSYGYYGYDHYRHGGHRHYGGHYSHGYYPYYYSCTPYTYETTSITAIAISFEVNRQQQQIKKFPNSD